MRHAAIAFALLALACGGEPTEPEPEPLSEILPTSTLEIVAGDLQRDTILARLSEPLTVRLTDGEGLPVPDAPIRYVVTEDGCGEAFLGHTTTDALGEASDVWDLGTLAAECTMEVRALDEDDTPRIVESFTATVEPGAPVYSPYWIDEGPGGPAHRGDSIWVSKETQGIEDQAGNLLPFTITILSGPFEAAELEHNWVIRADTLGTGSAEVSTDAGVWLEITVNACEDDQGDMYVRWTPARFELMESCP